MADSNSQESALALAIRPDTVLRSLKVALVIGTLLGAINHYEMFLSGHFEGRRIVQILVSYLVPFLVATYGAVSEARSRVE